MQYREALSRTAFPTDLPVVEAETSANKINRMYGLAPNFENGRIEFPDPEIARSNGANDDQVDSLVFAFEIVDVPSIRPAFGFGRPWDRVCRVAQLID